MSSFTKSIRKKIPSFPIQNPFVVKLAPQIAHRRLGYCGDVMYTVVPGCGAAPSPDYTHSCWLVGSTNRTPRANSGTDIQSNE